MKKRITLSDIAELAGVSKTTASMILNGQAEQYRIKEETRQKVMEAVQKSGYRANAYAKALKQQRSNVIGLVIPISLITALRWQQRGWKNCVGKMACIW